MQIETNQEIISVAQIEAPTVAAERFFGDHAGRTVI
jgi:hypothetical protein